ncbi:MAG TPA: alpha/beta hydrolase [Steroidobacteraceae bacterium]|nr:alpha/beta hydrolase [Steroidobacteraceae bacterium]
MRQVTGALVWVGVSVCAWWALPAAAEEAPTLPLIECRLEHPLHLTSIPARCGTLRVPLDREHPKEGSVDLKVAVVPALNRRSTAAPLFLLAGGPGQSAMQVYVSLNAAFSRISRNHAIVLLDQRGTGQSSLQSCAYPEDWQEPADPIPALRKATVECLAKLGPHVRFYTTSIAVRDLDDMRIALGYDQIDLYGGSYGTRVAELYMRRYPAHVQAVILDGVTYPQQAIGAETPQDAERSLNLIVARCLQTPDCAATYPQLQDDLTNLLREYGPKKTPVTIDDPNSGLPLEIEFNRRILDAALRMLSYSSMQASLLPTLIHGAAHGKLRPLAAQSVMNMRQISDQLANGMQYSVICSEDEPFFAAANIDRAAMAKTYQGTDMVDALHEICALWPRGPVDADLHAPLRSEVPTLLLSGEADPVTPPVDAERAAAGLTRHRHLILKGEGHGQLATGCMPTLTADFLDNLAPDKLDATCLDRHTPEPFFLSMTGPAP